MSNISPPKSNSDTISLSEAAEPFSHFHEPILERREKSRFYVALVIVGSLFAIVICAFLTLSLLALGATGISVADLKDIIATLIAPVAGVVGAVTGFYFGERQRGADSQTDDP